MVAYAALLEDLPMLRVAELFVLVATRHIPLEIRQLSVEVTLPRQHAVPGPRSLTRTALPLALLRLNALLLPMMCKVPVVALVPVLVQPPNMFYAALVSVPPSELIPPTRTIV